MGLEELDACAGYDGHKKRKDSKVRLAVDTLGQVLRGLIAAYEAGRLLHVTKSTLVALLGSVALRCIDGEVDEGSPPVPPAAGMWPRVVTAVAYDELGNLQIGASTTTTARGTNR